MRYTQSESPFSLTPWVRGLLIANAVVYLLRLTVFTGPWFIEVFGFHPFATGRHWWSFVTYMFVHDGFLHLAFNMLLLFFFGPAVERRMRSPGFALYYFVCGLGGAALSYLMSFLTTIGYVVGSSAAVFGVALAFAMHWPDAPIFVFPLPVPIKAKWLVTFLVGLDILAAALRWQDGVAHFAHLGGFLFGFLYLRGEDALARGSRSVLRREPPLFASRRPAKRRTAERTARVSGTGELRSIRDEVDRVLDKISRSGMGSLTDDERRLLNEVSQQLRGALNDGES